MLDKVTQPQSWASLTKEEWFIDRVLLAIEDWQRLGKDHNWIRRQIVSDFYGKPIRTCEHCGGDFLPTRNPKKFCSDRCRQQAFQLKRKQV